MEKVIFLLYVIFIGINAIRGQPGCNHLGVKMYETLGCSPQYKPGENCPHHYTNCDYALPKDKCTFQGKFYALGEMIPSELTRYDFMCTCTNRSKSVPNFGCAILECTEFFSTLLKDCHWTYDLKTVCSTGQKCPPFDNINCLVDGNVVKEGQRFYPKDSCMECVCGKGYAGKYETPFCKKLSCPFELQHADKLEQKCAPVYWQKDDEAMCCPADFVCASEFEDIVKSNETYTSSEVCHFGQHVLRIGDAVKKTSTRIWAGELNCICKLPPFLTCVGKV